MRTIQFKTGETFDEIDVLKAVVSQNPDTGYSLDDVRQGVRVLDKLDAAKAGLVAFEEAEHAFAARRLRAFKWRAITPELLPFIDRVLEAKVDGDVTADD